MAELPRNWQLFIQRLRHTLSSMEKEELDSWLQESQDHRAWMDKEILPGELMSEIEIELRRDDEAIRRKFVFLRDEHEAMMSRHRAHVMKMWKRAAAVVLVAAAGTTFYMREKKELPLPPPLARFDPSIRQEDMVKVPRRPSMISVKGDTLRLDDIPVGEMRWQGRWQVTRTGKRAILLSQLTGQKGNTSPDGCSTVAIPYGESWTLNLPDRSRIQLAPGSTLAWRVNIDGVKKERAFALYGEAWCDMTADHNAPVFISTLKGGATVLGTRFDIRDRLQDTVAFVALETGKVRINSGEHSRILRPGEEGRISLVPGAVPIVAASPPRTRTEWRDSLFIFTNRNIKQVMQQVIEWYGLNGAEYDSNVDTVTPGVLGGGYAAKDLPAGAFLMQCGDDIIFRIDEGKIHVSKIK